MASVALLQPVPSQAQCLPTRFIVEYYQYEYGCLCQIGPCGPKEVLVGRVIYDCDGVTRYEGDTSCGDTREATEECPPCA